MKAVQTQLASARRAGALVICLQNDGTTEKVMSQAPRAGSWPSMWRRLKLSSQGGRQWFRRHLSFMPSCSVGVW